MSKLISFSNYPSPSLFLSPSLSTYQPYFNRIRYPSNTFLPNTQSQSHTTSSIQYFSTKNSHSFPPSIPTQSYIHSVTFPVWQLLNALNHLSICCPSRLTKFHFVVYSVPFSYHPFLYLGIRLALLFIFLWKLWSLLPFLWFSWYLILRYLYLKLIGGGEIWLEINRKFYQGGRRSL